MLRLVGENAPVNGGRVSVFYNNTWGTICGDGFDDTDAQIACNMLGFG